MVSQTVLVLVLGARLGYLPIREGDSVATTTENIPGFCHLHVHTHFSLLDGACRIDELVDAALADGQTAVGITDHGNLFGAIPFYKTCKKKGVRPILGIEAYVAGKSRLEKGDYDRNPTYHMTLLAENNVGWHNLIKLSSISYREGFYRKPRIDREVMAQHCEGVIALSGCLGGEVNQRILQGDMEAARAALLEMADIFGHDSFFLEIMDNGYADQPKSVQALRHLATETGLGLVATNDVHYLRRADAAAQDILLCINTGKAVQEQDRLRMEGEDLFFKTRAEMEEVFGDVPEALANTVRIAERCNVEIDFDTYHLPVFETSTGESADEQFERLCDEGVAERYDDVTPEVQERLTYEMDVIRKLGFVSYFLITWDFTRFARENHVPVGPGRGSAAGSIVAYALRITDIDPLRYGLLFERFLNVERVSMPDIDIDFCRDGREKVIDYVRTKYGSENVSQIITFGTMASRGVIRDVGRALDIPLGEIDTLAKKIPAGPGASLHAALQTDHELIEIKRTDTNKAQLFDIGVKLEGLCRHASTHAAGVVIADKPLDEYVPLYRNGEDITTQWQMTDLEDVGLLKMDFLGLKTLTIIQEALDLIRDAHGVEVDLTTMPLDDEATYHLLSTGGSLGVFQLESEGMRELMVKMQPSCFEDLIALIALYRPGPLKSGMADTYVRRKHGQEPVDYPHDSLEPILRDTYGVIVYQEQVMLIAHHLAGFTLNQADSLRKAMGKKKHDVMAAFREQFVEGCVAQGHHRQMADDLFTNMEYFAGYGFNKSHSAAYAVLTYRTAWLKATYPTELLCALLTCDMGLTDKLKEFIEEARRMQIAVLPPAVNASRARFTVEDGAIRYGLAAIKGLGEKAADKLVAEREESGPFADVHDLARRWDAQIANKTCYEVLAKSGTFDTTGWSRRAVFEVLEGCLREAANVQADRKRGQSLMFGDAPTTASAAVSAPDVSEWPETIKLAMEKEALGLYLSGHPFKRRGKFFSLLAGADTRQIHEARNETSKAKREIVLAGMVSGLRPSVVRSGKNAGQRMAKFRLEDLHGSVSATVFSKQSARLKDRLADDALVFVHARIDRSSEEAAILIDDVQDAQTFVRSNVDAVVLRVDPAKHDADLLQQARDNLQHHRGRHRVFVDVADDLPANDLPDKGRGHYRLMADPKFNVELTAELLEDLSSLLGRDALSFTRR